MKWFLTIIVSLICLLIDVGIVIYFLNEVKKVYPSYEAFILVIFGLIFITLITALFCNFIDDFILEKWIDNY